MAPRLPLSFLRTSHSTTARVRAVCGGKMKIVRSLAAITVVACLPVTLTHAESDPRDAVIVTATRTAVTADELLASATVLTRADIARSGARNVPELLRGVAGMDFATQGGYGKLTNSYVRGTNPGQVLVLIDGVKIGSATAGTPAWEFLPLSEIDRVEIVRGPRSSLYGSEAVGGVVQIFTRRDRGPVRPRADFMSGSDHANEIGAGMAGEIGDTWFNIHASRFATRGFDARQPTVEFGTPLDEPDRDGYRNRSASARIGQRLGGGAEWELHGLHAEGNTEYDSTDNNEDDFTQQAFGGRLQLRPAAAWDTTLRVGRSRDDRLSTRLDGVPTFSGPTRFDTIRDTFSWQNDISVLENQTATLGYDVTEDRVRGTTAYTRSSRDNAALFTQYQARVGRSDVLLGLRRDHNEQFGTHHTGNFALGYAIRNGRRLVLSHGTGFRAPTFNDLYFPGASNPDLRPERARTTEIGVKSGEGTVRWSAFAFHTRVRDLIVFDLSTFTPQNVEAAVIDGMETEGTVTLDSWRVSGSLTFLDPRDEATNLLLPRRARRSASLSLDRRFGQTELGASVLAQDARYDDKANTTRLGGYGILNLHARRSLARDWELRLRLENVLDKAYQTIATYNSPGRSLFLSASYQPK
jgi:vitamin B12 transporter